MNTTIIHNIGFYHLIAVCHHNIGKCITQQVITYMTQVKWFIGVRGRVLNHYQRRIIIYGSDSVLFIGMDHIQQFNPCRRGNSQVQETFNHIKSSYCRLIGLQILTDFLCRLLRSFLRHTQKREHNQGQMSFKFFFSFLQLHLRGRYLLTVKGFQSVYYGIHKFILYIHSYIFFLRAKIQKRRR